MQVRQLGYIRFLAQPGADKGSAHLIFLDFVPASRQKLDKATLRASVNVLRPKLEADICPVYVLSLWLQKG